MGGGNGSVASEARSGQRGERRRGGEDKTDKWGRCVSGWIERRRRERKA
jgi:hypothetical protein